MQMAPKTKTPRAPMSDAHKQALAEGREQGRAVRQYLEAQLIDEMHLAVRPVLLGRGEHLLAALDLRARGYDVAEMTVGRQKRPTAVSVSSSYIHYGDTPRDVQ